MIDLHKHAGLYYAFGQLDALAATMEPETRRRLDANTFSDRYAALRADGSGPSVQDAWSDYVTENL
jgi:hypothetical protein